MTELSCCRRHDSNREHNDSKAECLKTGLRYEGTVDLDAEIIILVILDIKELNLKLNERWAVICGHF